MSANKRVVIDAGHGGDYDPGAVYMGRQEKTDNLRLALAVGGILEDNGIDVVYTRTTDVYDTPYEKATMANEADADYFISIHRNAAAVPGNGSGTMTLVYEDSGVAGEMAASINRELQRTGFADIGTFERPDLIVLRRTSMPSVLVEAGFIDNPLDNERFDQQFEELAAAIATGVLGVVSREEETGDYYYMIQTGLFRVRSYADQQLQQLKDQGYPAFMLYNGEYYRVMANAFRNLDNAVNTERQLRQAGYPTFMVYETAQR